MNRSPLSKKTQFSKSARYERLKQAFAWSVFFVLIFIVGILAAQSFEPTKGEKEEIKPTSKQGTTKSSPKISPKSPTGKPKLPPEPKSTAKFEVEVAINGLNLRSSPEVKIDNIITQLPQGTPLEVLEEKGGWLRVQTPEGQTGYVSGRPRYVKKKD